MPKPKKNRFVEEPPSVFFFKPQGIPLFRLVQVVLGIDEYEVIRLVDYEGMQQKEAAEKMKISRATCARILESAHKKIAQAITKGQAIKIEGGSVVLGRNRYRCRNCDTFWGSAGDEETTLETCPKCKSDRVVDLGREVGAYPTRMERMKRGRGPHRHRERE